MVILKINPDAECPICLHPFLVKGATQGKAMTGGKCEHAFCRPCFRRWWSMNPSCPVCRESLIIDQPILVVPLPPKPLIDLRPSIIRRRLIDSEWRKEVVLPLRLLVPKKIRTFALLDVYDGTPCSPSIVELSLIPLTPIVLPLAPFKEIFVDEKIVIERIRDRKRKSKKPFVSDNLLFPIKMARKGKTTSNGKRAEGKESSVIYVRASDGPKNLDTLPQLPFDQICFYVIADGNFDSLGNLRKVNTRCKASVETFLEMTETIPPVEAIILSDMDKYDLTSFMVELRIRSNLIPMNLNIAALRLRILSTENYGGVVGLKIGVRNRKDKVIDYIHDALSPRVRHLSIGRFRSLDEIRFVRRMIGQRNIEKMTIKLAYALNSNNTICSEIISMVEEYSISCLEYYDQPISLDSTSAKKHIERLVHLTNEGQMYCQDHHQFNISVADWRNIENSVKKTYSHARFHKYGSLLEHTYIGFCKKLIFEWKK